LWNGTLYFPEFWATTILFGLKNIIKNKRTIFGVDVVDGPMGRPGVNQLNNGESLVLLREMKMEKIKTTWTNQHIPVLSDQESTRLYSEINIILSEIENPSDLIFHTVFLTDDMDGPIVIVSGEDGNDDELFLAHYEKTNWVSLDAPE
jgi:hypothetical protein